MNFMTKEKHYNTINNYYRKTLGGKVYKIPLNANFTCPNKDGVKGYGGCTYCSESGSGDFAGKPSLSLKEQFNEVRKAMEKKWTGEYIAYLQANTNTYAPLDKLKKIYEEILSFDDIIGLSISTRPDCLEDETIEYLGELNKHSYIQIELGLQSIHEETSLLINRCHNLECFDVAVKKLRKKNIDVVVHIIDGFPNETPDMMYETIKHLNTLDIQGVKIHLLHILKNTRLGLSYLEKPFKILSIEEYTEIVVHQLRLLNPNIIIHRITGDAPRDLLIEPKWSLKKFVVINEIDKLMRKMNVFQGDLFE